MLRRIASSDGRRLLLAGSIAALAFSGLAGCAFLGGAAVGAAGAGTAYEVQNREALQDLDESYAEGRISRDEYLRRRHAIEERSAVY